MILLKKRVHLVLKTSPAMMVLLRVDVLNQCIQVRRADREQTISPLPRKIGDSVFLHPDRRRRLHLRDNLRGKDRRIQSDCKVNMICDPAHAEALAIQFARCPGNIGVKVCGDVISNKRKPTLGAEDNMHEVETQRLGHSGDYISGLQPSSVTNSEHLGLRPRLVCHWTFGPELGDTAQ